MFTYLAISYRRNIEAFQKHWSRNIVITDYNIFMSLSKARIQLTLYRYLWNSHMLYKSLKKSSCDEFHVNPWNGLDAVFNCRQTASSKFVHRTHFTRFTRYMATDERTSSAHKALFYSVKDSNEYGKFRVCEIFLTLISFLYF